MSVPHRARLALAALLVAPLVAAPPSAAQGRARPACAPDNGGLTLPRGFCATIFAGDLPAPRHLVVRPNGDVVVSLLGGGLAVLRDTTGDGVADVTSRFGEGSMAEVAIRGDLVYAENGGGVVRYHLPAGALRPTAGPETIVSGLPRGGHPYKTFALDSSGALYVNVGSATNACQVNDRAEESPGKDPCRELETRAGIWRFDANRTGQTERTGVHYATGIRNAVGIAISPADGRLWVTQHGRDQLGGNWPKLFTTQQNAEKPAEELFVVRQGDDFGWPYCYFDPALRRKVLAPEYGGDGQQVGRCAGKKGNVAYFPAHWAPNALLFYTGTTFPARYRSGVFIAFHGSWNRAPEPQAGFNVVFQPLNGEGAAGSYEIFADGFTPAAARDVGRVRRGSGNARPTGLAQGPDGALYVSDDASGRIWRIVYRGE